MNNHKCKSQFNLPPNNIPKKIRKRAKKIAGSLLKRRFRKQKEFSKQTRVLENFSNMKHSLEG